LEVEKLGWRVEMEPLVVEEEEEAEGGGGWVENMETAR